MDIDIGNAKAIERMEQLNHYYELPLSYKMGSSLPNKSTFRDFYPFGLRPIESNLAELRRALHNITQSKNPNERYHLNYSGNGVDVSTGDIEMVLRFLMDVPEKTPEVTKDAALESERGGNERDQEAPEREDAGSMALMLNPQTQNVDAYESLGEGRGYYSRSSVLVPTDYLIEKFISIEGRYIGDFEYIFGFPISFLFGLFSYPTSPTHYPEGTAFRTHEESIGRGAEFFMNSPYSLKNFSGVSEFLESVTRMILMDVIDQSILLHDRSDITIFYWNTKTMGLSDGKDYEKMSGLFLNVALDCLYMGMHSNYYAMGKPQGMYVRSIGSAHITEYDAVLGDAKFMNLKYGFHSETALSYALYPFITTIYSGFLSGFSPSAMVSFGQTVFRTFVGKQLRWFRYSWQWEAGGGSRGFYEGRRGSNPWPRHGIMSFVDDGTFMVSREDIDFLKRVMKVPLETFIRDYDSGSGPKKYATEKDRYAASAYLEYVTDSIDWIDLGLSDEEFARKHPNIFLVPQDRARVKWTDDSTRGMLSRIREMLSPYIEGHEETGYSPLPHLFSNRGLFKHYLNPYDYMEAERSGSISSWKELEFYKDLFEKDTALGGLNDHMSLLSPPLAQPVDEVRFNVLMDDDDIGLGSVARELSEYFFGGFSPSVPFRALPIMIAISYQGVNIYMTSAEIVAGVEITDSLFAYQDRLPHLVDMHKTSDWVSALYRGLDKKFDFDASIEKIREIEASSPFQPFGFSYYYFLASNTGNFFYRGDQVADMITGESGSLFIEPMNKVIFEASYEAAADRIYSRTLPPSWFAGTNPNTPFFRSDELITALDGWKLFKDRFVDLLEGDFLLMSVDDYKRKWSTEHGGSSPNAYEYCEAI